MTKRHVWAENDYDGNVDVFGLEFGHHNGPRCVNCGYSFCHHCEDFGSNGVDSTQDTYDQTDMPPCGGSE